MLDEETGLYYGKHRIIDLSQKETRLLHFLIMKKNSIAKPGYLIPRVFGKEYKVDKCSKSCLYMLIHKLKKKLEGEVKITSKIKLGYVIQYIGG